MPHPTEWREEIYRLCPNAEMAADISTLVSSYIEAAERRGVERAIEVVNGIKNNTNENGPIEWYNALHCVRHSLEALLSAQEH
jgi:hypothetical protein